MSFAVTADPTVAWVDAISARLKADATLVGLVAGIAGHVPEGVRTPYPYVVLGRRGTLNNAGAMGLPGSILNLQIDTWSDANGPYQVTNICSRIYAVLERAPLVVPGFDLIRGSLTREFQDVFDEPDPDKPTASLYHGVQRWTAEIHELSTP